MNLDKFINEKIAIKFENSKEIKEFLKECDKRNLYWCGGDKASEFVPGTECIAYKFGTNNGLSCGSAFTYKECNWKVIDYKDFAKGINLQSFNEINKIITNGEATIVFWNNDTKTIVKRGKGQKNSQELAILYAYFQKHSGLSKTKANKAIQDLISNIYMQG